MLLSLAMLGVCALLGAWALARLRLRRLRLASTPAPAVVRARRVAPFDAEEDLHVLPLRGGIEVSEDHTVIDLDALFARPSGQPAAWPAEVATQPASEVARAVPAPRPAVVGAAGADPVAALVADLAVHELVVTLYRMRGYRLDPGPAPPPPVDAVLRHRDDPQRAYAVVRARADDADLRDGETGLQAARALGVRRVLLVAERAGSAAATADRAVRVVDREALLAQLRKCDLRLAAKVIAAARQRAGAAVLPDEARAVL